MKREGKEKLHYSSYLTQERKRENENENESELGQRGRNIARTKLGS